MSPVFFTSWDLYYINNVCFVGNEVHNADGPTIDRVVKRFKIYNTVAA